MAQIDNKQPTMDLYVERNSILTHWVYFVLAEKSVEPNLIFVEKNQLPPDLSRINPYGVLPTLLDREALFLYTASIIAEYLEERFPHPQLLPVYPIRRARCRQMIHQISRDWYALLDAIDRGQSLEKNTQVLQRSLLNLAPIFHVKPYFLHDELTLVDCCIAPLLWCLKKSNPDILGNSQPMLNYQTRLFERQAFQDSLRALEADGSK